MIRKLTRFNVNIAISFAVIILLTNFVYAYDFMPPNRTVHQHIAKEAVKVWPLIPIEIKNHSSNNINATLGISNLATTGVYSNGDDIITGTGEEDLAPGVSIVFNTNHFFQPDNPTNGSYDDGLGLTGSSYRRALSMWENDVIKNYLKGDINKSYYYLGRIIHLLEDSTSVPHVHLDAHPPWDDSVLEEYTANNFQTLKSTYNWTGSNFAGQQYNYENLPNMQNFNWKEVDPLNPSDKRNIEFFRLFWYTAQKTQYFASEDADGNTTYTNLSGATKSFSTSLWTNDNVTIINNSADLADDDVADTGADIEKETNAMIPHAMRAVAGLYRLFDDAVRIDWPTENHDYRRTGFTLLKGDLTQDKTKNAMDFFLDAGEGTEQVVKPSIADIDADGVMDIVTLVHKSTSSNFTKMYGIEAKKPFFGKPARKWKDPVVISNGEEGTVYFPPTLANIDGDINKEIITGNRNGTVFVYDYANGKITQKWNYTFESRSDGLNDRVKFNGGSAVADIDLDGDMEIIVADVLDNEDDWPGKVYVLDGATGVNITSLIVGNGGAYASVSVANVDSDDYPEIVVATQYGIKVLDYNPSTNKLTEKCSNTHGLIEGSAVVADVDNDNDYEIVYVTNDHVCAAGKTCLNRLYVLNASSCTNELTVTFSDIPRPTITVANLDSDSQSEIIVSSVSSITPGLGNITAIDSITGTRQWSYNAGGSLHPGFVSPNIADIDNDGNYNIILGENDGSTVYILNHTGKLFFEYKVTGFMDNGIAIADLDNDGMAEIAFKRAASPETVFVSVSNTNTPPEITKSSNVTAIAGDMISMSNLILTQDLEGNSASIFYSSPLNSSGQWQTTVNDTGNYSILIEASDGNLSTTQFIDVIVFNQTTKLQNNFTDGTNQKLLNFTQAGNQTVKVRLPKNATVIYSKLKITGLSP